MHPLSNLVTILLAGMALGRIAIGLAPFVAAGALSAQLGFPPAHDTPTSRLMARFFGVRDAGLGVLVVYAIAHPETAGFVLLFNAAMDAGDLVSISIPLIGRHGIDRAALTSALFAATACTAWFVMWAVTR
jgi:hypothetical protein